MRLNYEKLGMDGYFVLFNNTYLTPPNRDWMNFHTPSNGTTKKIGEHNHIQIFFQPKKNSFLTYLTVLGEEAKYGSTCKQAMEAAEYKCRSLLDFLIECQRTKYAS